MIYDDSKYIAYIHVWIWNKEKLIMVKVTECGNAE